jgi:hypothetical protein
VVGIAWFVGFIYGLILFGDAFRAYTPLFAVIWLAAPIGAFLLHRKSVAECFTLNGMRWVQGILIAVAAAISFAMFANHDQVRNKIGRRYVEGYRYWRAEPEIDDSGQPYYPGDNWSAKNSAGRWGLNLFGLGLLVGVFAVPAGTWKISAAAINRKRHELVHTMEGTVIETYESKF